MSTQDGQIIETERLYLRKLTMSDLDALAELYRDADVRKYFPEGVLTYDETREELEWIIQEYYGKCGYGLWAAIDKTTGEFMGRSGLLPWKIEGEHEVEVAYLFAKKFWGQGYGTEAARALVKYAFGELKMARLICMMYPENIGSVKVAENAGFSFEKDMVDDKGPYLLYAQTRGERWNT